MRLVLSALIFSVSSNLDNLVIGIAYGLKKIKISLGSNVIIGLVTCIITLISMLLGLYISNYLSPSVENAIGSISIISLGIYFLIQSILNLRKHTKSKDLALKDINDMADYAEKSDRDKSGTINVREAFFVSLGLGLNNLGTGIAASISGVNFPLTVIFTFILSIIAIILGQSLGNNVLGKILGKYSPLISGCLLIILGVVEFFA